MKNETTYDAAGAVGLLIVSSRRSLRISGVFVPSKIGREMKTAQGLMRYCDALSPIRLSAVFQAFFHPPLTFGALASNP